jgi:hypothetical protein
MHRSLVEEMEEDRINSTAMRLNANRLAAYENSIAKILIAFGYLTTSCNKNFRCADSGGYFDEHDGAILDI